MSLYGTYSFENSFRRKNHVFAVLHRKSALKSVKCASVGFAKL